MNLLCMQSFQPAREGLLAQTQLMNTIRIHFLLDKGNKKISFFQE